MQVSQRRALVQKAQPTLSISRQCELLALNRSSLYYQSQSQRHHQDAPVLERIRRIMVDFPFYGSRKVTETLKQQGLVIGRNRVRRLLCQLNLQALRPKPARGFKRQSSVQFPYLLDNLVLTQPNQVWVSDITYIPTHYGWAYLAVIMDRYSRKVLGHCVSSSLEAWPVVELFKRTIRRYGAPYFINTDQGSQYTSQDWLQVAKDHGIQVSMAGKGRCYDNIHMERFFRSLKQEAVYLNEYPTLKDARQGIQRYIQTYNDRRLHASLNYQTPTQVYSRRSLFRASPEQGQPPVNISQPYIT